jgi:hypothetical protein
MRKIGILGLVGVLALVLAGCGGGSSGPPPPPQPPSSADIPGDRSSDGYAESPPLSPLAVQNDGIRAQSLFGLSPERRGFASYPLTAIPVGAFVQTADVRLFVDRVIQDVKVPGVPLSGTPVILDVYHVYYGSPLFGSDFSAPRVYVTTFVLFEEDAGKDLPFFEYASILQLDVDDPNHAFFQLMLVATNGVVEIEDSENTFGTTFTPLLQMTFLPP